MNTSLKLSHDLTSPSDGVFGVVLPKGETETESWSCKLSLGLEQVSRNSLAVTY
ncbi:unnamed protein product [Nezara viridula]|uniref:Uncharacterized protein n=1 Tax=Nezara viridula TaxID=85310 RepID=A0A9P0HNY9_NEZVI|nr:unnamed protein product [Nezara viridula]